MAKSITGRLRLDPESYKKHKAALKELEKAVRKEIIEAALMAGGKIIHAAAESRAPGKLELRIVGGRSLRKRVDGRLTAIVKANGKFCVIGPDKKHWHYRFFEFGATKHDIKPKNKSAIAFEGRNGLIVTGSATATGGVRMRPFMRPAVDENKDAAVVAMGNVLANSIEKAAAKGT
jgi:HK97 gp10 family phage protein